MKQGNVIVGLLAGLAAGAVLGILFAPEKGSDTRKKITNKGKTALDDLKNKYNDAINHLNSKLDKTKNNGLKIYHDGHELVENTKNKN
ncbi:YtxH domain-containing protein [Flavobacterium sp.]|uniref:YtxH domain-containing protein n=1 Tax=Flavobacterium sp. TaxID=239 RepID=UPI0037503885